MQINMKPTCFPITTCPDIPGITITTKSGTCVFSRWSGTGYHPIKINYVMMKRTFILPRIRCILIILTLAFLNCGYGFETSAQDIQTRTITGVVRDAVTGNTLPGVNIAVKGTRTGTITNFI